jgi:hypothetical protein
MSDSKMIRGIRYYESTKPNVDGQDLPGDTGVMFAFPETIHAIGERIARKLQEKGFTSGSFNHLYINFTTVLPSGEIVLSNRSVLDMVKYIDYGLNPQNISGLTTHELERFITDCTFRTLTLVALNKEQLLLLNEVKKAVEDAGDSLEILFKTKETAKYKITISYQIKSHPECSVAFINYYDKITQNSGKRHLTRLQLYQDMHSLVGSVIVSGNEILIRPLTSFRASMDLERYRTPIRITVEDVLSNKPGYVFDALI